jgi:molecular chaperone DnaK
MYLADKWTAETGSAENPLNSRETQQDLLQKTENAKWTLSARQEATVMVAHEGQRVPVKLSREKFDELTASLLERTIQFTKETLEEAKKRGFAHFDQILLVGGSTRMQQVKARLEREFSLPMQLLDPDEAVAKGAATYAQKLSIDEKIKYELALALNAEPTEVSIEDAPKEAVQQAQQAVARKSGLRLDMVEKYAQMSTINVASHSFGVVAWAVDPLSGQQKQVISNLILVNDPVPATASGIFGTYEANQEAVELEVMENAESDKKVEDITKGTKLGDALLPLSTRLPKGSVIEVTFHLNQEGRLEMKGHEPLSKGEIHAEFQTKSVVSEAETQVAKSRRVVIS